MEERFVSALRIAKRCKAERYLSTGSSLTLQHDKIWEKRWKFRTLDGKVTLWRPAAVKYFDSDKKLDPYGILRLTDRSAEQAWKTRRDSIPVIKPSTPTDTPQANRQQVTDLEFHKRVNPSSLKIEVEPAAKATRIGKNVLLRVGITNKASEILTTTLAHEWHGGEWPPTNLYASVTPAKEAKTRPFVPVYLAGEDQQAARLTAIAAGKSKQIELRMNWPGTGSVKGQRLIHAPGTYKVQLLLVFEFAGRRQYVTTAESLVKLEPLAIRIELRTADGKPSPKTTFPQGNEVSPWITITNQTVKDLQAPETYWSARVLFDKKEYKRLPNFTQDWSGPALIIAGGKFGMTFSLSQYGITKDMLTPGKHALAVKIGEVVSNTLTISVAEEQATAINPLWETKHLQHEVAARDVFTKNGFLYIGGGAPDGIVAKIKISDGSIAWSVHTQQSYQPSYPVSNGRVVVFGRYYEDRSIVGLDDRTGKLLWTIPMDEQNMSAACFDDDLAFIGSYDKHLYAIDWSKGKVRWKTRLPNRIWSTPSPYEKLILVGCYDGFLYAIEQDTGKIAWKLNCGGTIGSNPVVANHHAFLGVDDQKYGEDHDSSKVQKHFLVIDLKTRKIIARYRAATRWSSKIVVSNDDVYFFDHSTLYAFDSKRAKLAWKVNVQGKYVLAFPLVTKSTIIAGMNLLGEHGEFQTRIVTFDRATGKELSTYNTGGIGIRNAHYVQHGNLVVTTDYLLQCYQVGTSR